MDVTYKRCLTSLIGAMALLTLAACNPFSDPSAAEPMTVAPEGTGSITVRRAGNNIKVTGRFSLDVGDVVRTSSVPARVRLEGARSASLAVDTNIRITGGDSLELLDGKVLAVSSAGMTVAFDDVTASTGDGIVRVDRALASAEAVSYEGVAEVAALGQEKVRLRPLFEVSVAAGAVLHPRPYGIDAGDPWDRSRLTEVVELDEQLQSYARAMRGQLGRVGAGYFSGLGGEAVSQAMVRYIGKPAYTPPDLLIGFSIARLEGLREFDESLRTTFRLSRAGGAWGVIATIMHIPADPLFASLEDAILASGAIASRSKGSGAPAGDGVVDEPSSPGAPDERDNITRGGTTGGADGGGNDFGSSDGAPGGSDGSPGGGGGTNGPPEEDCANVVDCLIDGLSLPGLP